MSEPTSNPSSPADSPADKPSSLGYADSRTPTALDRFTRERRANLIFIGIMVLLTLPAMIVTVVKFVRGIEAKRPLVPPAMRSQFAYMDTTPSLIGIPRVVPPKTGSFVAAQANRLVRLEPGLRSIVADGDFRPVISEGLHVQLIAQGTQDGGYRLGIIGWHPKFAPMPQLYTFTGHRADGSTAPGTMRAYESGNLPLDVREELQKYGYIQPPSGIVWAILYFDGTEPIRRLDVEYKTGEFVLRDTLPISQDESGIPAPGTPK